MEIKIAATSKIRPSKRVMSQTSESKVLEALVVPKMAGLSSKIVLSKMASYKIALKSRAVLSRRERAAETNDL